MPRIQFRNHTAKPVWVGLKRTWLEANDWERVTPKGETDFGRETDFTSSWTVVIAREALIPRKPPRRGSHLHTVRRLARDAIVTLKPSKLLGTKVSTSRQPNLGTATIDHVVVLMLENRSFDNILGWMYDGTDTSTLTYIPPRTARSPLFQGLEAQTYWNPDASGDEVYAEKGTSGKGDARWTVPDPDPREQFRFMNQQQFGLMNPASGAPATMKGFITDYAGIEANTAPNQIMESYSPAQVPILTKLARQYAVCDRWFGSAPCQTWPNRGFMHAGTSNGRINNLDGAVDSWELPNNKYYDVPVIYEFLDKVGASWSVYSGLFSLTHQQFRRRFDKLKHAALKFLWFAQFKVQARLGTLPYYSFIEPTHWLVAANDQHPPHDIRRAEKLIHDVYTAVSTGKKWANTLLIITYDEHGGCYDHVPPPAAVPPDDAKPQKPPVEGITPFDFKRYGPRVPTVVINPHIRAKTVFRSGSADVEYDHTSILATLREWLDPSGKTFNQVLKSKRIAKAPTLAPLPTLTQPRPTLPKVPKPVTKGYARARTDLPLNDIQKMAVAVVLAKRPGQRLDAGILARHGIRTVQDAVRALGGNVRF